MQLARQAEAEAGTQAVWQEKQERRERRHVEIESQKERERRARAEQGRRVRQGLEVGEGRACAERSRRAVEE